MNDAASHTTDDGRHAGYVLPATDFLSIVLPRVASIGRLLPAAFISVHAAAALEAARYMRWLEPPTGLDGRSFAILVEDLGLRCCFGCRDGRFHPLSHTRAVDLQIAACLGDFSSLACGTMDADTLFFQRRLKVSGDTDLGLIVKNWLDAIERPAWLSSLGNALRERA